MYNQLFIKIKFFKNRRILYNETFLTFQYGGQQLQKIRNISWIKLKK